MFRSALWSLTVTTAIVQQAVLTEKGVWLTCNCMMPVSLCLKPEDVCAVPFCSCCALPRTQVCTLLSVATVSACAQSHLPQQQQYCTATLHARGQLSGSLLLAVVCALLFVVQRFSQGCALPLQLPSKCKSVSGLSKLDALYLDSDCKGDPEKLLL